MQQPAGLRVHVEHMDFLSNLIPDSSLRRQALQWLAKLHAHFWGKAADEVVKPGSQGIRRTARIRLERSVWRTGGRPTSQGPDGSLRPLATENG